MSRLRTWEPAKANDLRLAQVMFWFIAGALFLSLLSIVCFVPAALNVNLQLRAEPSGIWAAALGVELGPLSLSAVAAAGVSPFFACHAFGRQIARLPLARVIRRTRSDGLIESSGAREPERSPSALELGVARFLRGAGTIETLLSGWENERTIAVSSLRLVLEYSFRDVAFTGRVLAAFYALSGVLPDRYVIEQTPLWEFEDRLALDTDARIRIWLGRLLVGGSSFVLRKAARGRRKALPVSEPRGP